MDLKFSALKDLFPFSIVSKIQDASSILKVAFYLSKRHHLHRAYLETVAFRTQAHSSYFNYHSILEAILSKLFILKTNVKINHQQNFAISRPKRHVKRKLFMKNA